MHELCITGAAALDKKAKKQFDATELAKLGARAEKAQRMPASVGKGAQKRMNTVCCQARACPVESWKQGCDSCCTSTLSARKRCPKQGPQASPFHMV
jgi:Domain of unknown function (DUF4602)